MFNWILKFIPQEYKWGVGIKKASYAVGKLVVSLLTFGKAKMLVGDKLTPDQILQVQTTIAAITAAALEGIHDWARVKWPDVKWL